MKRMDDIWTRLAATARHAPPEGDVTAPSGFATRVVAHAFSARRSYDSMFERLAMRMMGVSCLVALFAVITYFSVVNPAESMSLTDTLFQLEDPASLIVGDVSYE